MAQTPDSSPPFARLDVEILDRYLAGLASPAECADVEAWLATDAERGAVLALLQSSPRESAAANTDSWWHKLEPHLADPAPHLAINRDPAGIGFGERRPVLSGTRPRRFWASASTRRFAIGTALAGACMLGIVGGLTWARRAGAPATPHTLRQIATANGQRASLELADGSRVILGVHSTLRVPTDFGVAARDVYLEGQGYFEVRHDVAHPFRVHAGGGVAEDLGTRFSVRAYAGDRGAQVVVAEGMVALSTVARRPVALTANEAGQLTPGGVVTVEHVDASSALAWTEGRLVFANTTVRDVIPELGRWYDLDVRLTDAALAERHVTGSFTTEPVADVLEAIASAAGLRVTQHGRTVTFSRVP